MHTKSEFCELNPNQMCEEVTNFKYFLEQAIKGQPEAIESIAEAFLLAQEGVRLNTGPLASFFFLGPTGVGKTETVNRLSEAIYGTETESASYLRIDCGEIQHGHQIAKLIGAPPGYVGYYETHVAFHPNTIARHVSKKEGTKGQIVILFDEIEKAHPDLHRLILPLLDSGRISTSDNKTSDLRNSFIIFTSNLASREIDEIVNERGIGFGPGKINNTPESAELHKKIYNVAQSAFNKHFPPEFFSRIHRLVVFRRLPIHVLKEILEYKLIQFQQIIEQNRKRSFYLYYTEEAKAFLVEKGSNHQRGARELQYAINTFVAKPINQLLLTKQIEFHKTVFVDHCAGNDYLSFGQERKVKHTNVLIPGSTANQTALVRVQDQY